MIGLVESSIKLDNKMELLNVVDNSMTNAKLIAVLAHGASALNSAIPLTRMISTPLMLSMVDMLNSTLGMAQDTEFVILPTLTMYMRPLDVVEYPVLGPTTLALLSAFPSLKIQQYTNRLPVHGYVTIDYWMPIIAGNNYRRQLVMSVGQRELSFNAIFSNFTSSEVLWVDRVQIQNGDGIWNDVAVLNKSEKADPLMMENDSMNATAIETYQIGKSVHYMIQFFKCMEGFEEPYDLFNHNCQTMSREIVNFCVNNSLPHWWDNLCSVEMLEAEFSKLYDLPVALGLGVMPGVLSVPTNYLTLTGPNPNALDVLRTDFITNVGNWLNDLLSAEHLGSVERKRGGKWGKKRLGGRNI
jgi:hypothetical protein